MNELRQTVHKGLTTHLSQYVNPPPLNHCLPRPLPPTLGTQWKSSTLSQHSTHGRASRDMQRPRNAAQGVTTSKGDSLVSFLTVQQNTQT